MSEEKGKYGVDVLGNLQSFGAKEESGESLLSGGMTLQRTQTAYTTAIAVQRPRSITRVTNNVLEEAKLAGASFYYGWNVKSKNGSSSRIEGPSVDLAMCIARNYGNCVVDIEGNETATHYMLKGYFIDLESGFTCPRLFRQRKSQSLGGKMEKDSERQEDIVFQIGQSKAIRNAIIRAMPEWLISKAIEAAKEGEKKNVGNITIAREKVISYFKPQGINQERLEAKMGKPADEWTEDDIVEIKGMATALKEGRVTKEELFPMQEVIDGNANKKTIDVTPESTETKKTKPEEKAPAQKEQKGLQPEPDKLACPSEYFNDGRKIYVEVCQNCRHANDCAVFIEYILAKEKEPKQEVTEKQADMFKKEKKKPGFAS